MWFLNFFLFSCHVTTSSVHLQYLTRHDVELLWLKTRMTVLITKLFLEVLFFDATKSLYFFLQSIDFLFYFLLLVIFWHFIGQSTESEWKKKREKRKAKLKLLQFKQLRLHFLLQPFLITLNNMIALGYHYICDFK